MKSILEFNLPDDNEEFEDALHGEEWKCIVNQLDQYLRNELKYNNELPDERSKIYQDLRDKLHELLNESNLILS